MNFKRTGPAAAKFRDEAKCYTCDFCSKKFLRPIELKSHLRSHTGEKPYTCEVCKIGFSQISNLKSHLRTHTGEKPYTCQVCKVRFSDRSNFNKHLRTHTGVKPYTCEVCKIGFSQKSDLKKHSSRVHGKMVPVSPTVKISAVKLEFRKGGGQTVEKKDAVHKTGLQTGENAKFSVSARKSKKTLSKIRTTTKSPVEEKPFVCRECKRGFNRSDHLKRHSFLHTGEKPFECDNCDTAFTEKWRLTWHKREIHTGGGKKPVRKGQRSLNGTVGNKSQAEEPVSDSGIVRQSTSASSGDSDSYKKPRDPEERARQWGSFLNVFNAKIAKK